MERKGWILTETDLKAWMQNLLQAGYSVVAPIEQDGIDLFHRIDTPDEVNFRFSKTRWSPKEFLFPRTETLYRYKLDNSLPLLEDPVESHAEQVLFGVRACDAAGFDRLDSILLSGRKDPFYAQRRARTWVIATACSVVPEECFCTAVGGSPIGTDGVDLQLFPLESSWLLAALTSQGSLLVDVGQTQWTGATEHDWERADEIGRKSMDNVRHSPIPVEFGETLEKAFEKRVWDIGERCLSCSICAYVCPSCACFDMNQEGNAWCGVELRSWDSCTFALFTRHASGHNPRPTSTERFRQRLLHKFSYMSEDDSNFRCVGCGRCLTLCPSGIDIYEAVFNVVAAFKEDDNHAEP